MEIIIVKMHGSFNQVKNVDLKGDGFLMILAKINSQNIQKIKGHLVNAQILLYLP